MRERGQEILIDRIALTKDALFLVHLRLEPLALQAGIDELAEGVHELNPAGIELEALRPAWIGRFGSRQRGKIGRIVTEDGGAALAKPRLDALNEHTGENVGPRIVIGYPYPGGAGRCRQALPPTPSVLEGVQIDAGEPVERFRNADPLRLRKRVGTASRVTQPVAADRCGSRAQQLRAILHQPLVGLMRPIPFQHRKGRMMQGAALAIAEHLGKGEDALLPGCQQLLARELGRSVKVKALARAVGGNQLGGEGEEVALVAGRHLERAGFHFHEALGLKPGPERGPNAPAREQKWPPVPMLVRAPPGAWLARLRQGRDAPWRCRKRPVESGQLFGERFGAGRDEVRFAHRCGSSWRWSRLSQARCAKATCSRSAASCASS